MSVRVVCLSVCLPAVPLSVGLSLPVSVWRSVCPFVCLSLSVVNHLDICIYMCVYIYIYIYMRSCRHPWILRMSRGHCNGQAVTGYRPGGRCSTPPAQNPGAVVRLKRILGRFWDEVSGVLKKSALEFMRLLFMDVRLRVDERTLSMIAQITMHLGSFGFRGHSCTSEKPRERKRAC